MKDAEDDLGTAATDEDAVEQATYELSKNQIDDNEEENGTSSYYREEENESDHQEDNNFDDDAVEEFEEDLAMIDHDAED